MNFSVAADLPTAPSAGAPESEEKSSTAIRRAKARIAVIGFGSRVAGLLATASAHQLPLAVSAVVDPHPAQAAARLRETDKAEDGCTFFHNIDEFLDSSSDVDALIISTRCRLHASLASKVAELRLPVFLEKPVATTMEDLELLRQSYAGQEDRVVVSFPLRVSPLFQAVKEVCDSGRLGQISQIQAVNYVPYGGVYFADWYRDVSETGGMWLQKATHDLDYLTLLAGGQPTWIFATESQTVFTGSRPFDLRCSNCADHATCPESPANLRERGDHGGMGDGDHWCVFSDRIHNHDSASALLGCSNGISINYTQNFITRRPAGWRGARITGYRATLEFDWRTGIYTVYDHHTMQVERQEIKTEGGHNGGDIILLRNFLDVIDGRALASPNLPDGIRSAELCFAAMRSCESRAAVSFPA